MEEIESGKENQKIEKIEKIKPHPTAAGVTGYKLATLPMSELCPEYDALREKLCRI